MDRMDNEQDLVIIDYEDLLSKPNDGKTPLHDLLSKAFGHGTQAQAQEQQQQSQSPSLGIIAIRNVPSFVQTKNAFLPLAHKLATLPPTYLEAHLTDPESLYNSGWSHGKEKLKLKDDLPDLSKGSFYFNPVTDVPGTEGERRQYPASYPVNRWPEERVIPQFEALGKGLGVLMKDVVALLAEHIDEFVKRECECGGGDGGDGGGDGDGGDGGGGGGGYTYTVSMGMEMKCTEKVKGRLLYYFPQEEKEEEADADGDAETHQSGSGEFDSWIGWHNDSGFLTALAGDIYVDHDTGEVIPKDQIDPKAGLYIQDRNGSLRKINIPDDCLAVQIGECLQIISGGSVVATPHCVKGADPAWSTSTAMGKDEDEMNVKVKREGSGGKRKIARISFPCFVDTVPSFPLSAPVGQSRESVLNSSVTGCAKVPPLADR